MRRTFIARAAVLAMTVGIGVAVAADEAELRDRRGQLARVEDEILTLERELAGLRQREKGLLGELESLGGELRLREAEHRQVSLELEQVNASIEVHDQNLDDLAAAQGVRRDYLEFRLREVYKAGPQEPVRRFVGGAEVDDYLQGVAYATYLSERDARVIQDFQRDAVSEQRERVSLETSRGRLVELRDDLDQARRRLQQAQRQHGAALRRVREDQQNRQVALDELRIAATELASLVDSLQQGERAATLDVRKFRGLLDWPAEGPVTAGFGTVVHPRFKTEVPHPGLDIDAPVGSSIVSVFDGDVVYAAWMRGYGLTAIVDHGAGLFSIYAHASVLTTSEGERVLRGQTLGKVGETGSLRGPFLYFELRVEGQPVDPREWLRRP